MSTMESGFKYGCLVLVALLLMQCNEKKEKTNELVPIPGTRVSLVPAPDFVLDPGIAGFKHTNFAATIMVVETPKTFGSIAAEISQENLSKSGMTLLSIDTVSIQGISGKLYKTSRLNEGLTYYQWVLLLPVQGHTLTVNGTFLRKDDDALSAALKQSLLSTRLSESHEDERVLSFTIKADSLRFAKILEGPSVMFTGSGAWNDSSIFDLSFFAGPSAAYQSSERSEEFALWQLKEICADCEVIKNGVHSVIIDSLSGYEVVALSKDSTGFVKRLKYQVMLFDSAQYYLLVGTSTKNSADRLEMFQEMSRSFKRKHAVAKG